MSCCLRFVSCSRKLTVCFEHAIIAQHSYVRRASAGAQRCWMVCQCGIEVPQHGHSIGSTDIRLLTFPLGTDNFVLNKTDQT